MLYRTFALYEEKKEFNVIKGKVPFFREHGNDLQLAVLINGTKSTEIPTSREYRVNPTCDDENLNISWNYSKWDLEISNFTKSASCSIHFDSIYDEIYVNGEKKNEFPPKKDYAVVMNCQNTGEYKWDYVEHKPIVNDVNSASSCTINFNSPTEFFAQANIGDYISYTPSKNSYTIPANETGYNTPEVTIHPNELNLWRVIRKNNDGTIELVSENVSSDKVAISSTQGCLGIVGILNDVARNYETEGITIGSRHMGYNNQVERYTDITCTEGNQSKLSDDGYTTDVNLVKEAKNTLIAYDTANTARNYWLASRYYQAPWNAEFYGRFIGGDGSLSKVLFATQYGGEGNNADIRIRPIVILKSGLKATDSGIKEDTVQNKSFKVWKVN